MKVAAPAGSSTCAAAKRPVGSDTSPNTTTLRVSPFSHARLAASDSRSDDSAPSNANAVGNA